MTRSRLKCQVFNPWIAPMMLGLLIGTAMITGRAFAADHGDGNNFQSAPEQDIADFFIFPRKDKENELRLSMIHSVHPNAAPDTAFSNILLYRFRVRPILGFQNDPFKARVAEREIRVDCRVSGTELQRLSCVLLVGEGQGPFEEVDRASVNTRDPGGGDNPDFLVFGGPRADQLFSDRARVRMPVWRDQEFDSPEWPGVNSQDGKNVLSIVVDLAAEKYFRPEDTLLAAVNETLIVGPESGRECRIDRMGRVEMTVFVVRDDPIRQLWNSEDTFDLDPRNVKRYRAELQHGLRRLDGFEVSEKGEDVFDWPNPHPWIDLLLDDFLIVDLRKPTRPSSSKLHYHEIEMFEYCRRVRCDGDFVESVGGRLPNENIIERMLTILINGLDRPTPSRGVGVPVPARATVDAFPFVPPPFEGTRSDD